MLHKKILFFSFLFISFNLLSQTISNQEIKNLAFNIIKESKNSVFITIDSLGKPTSRIMDHHIINKNFDIYLVTNPSSISINFQSPDGQNYVSINGKGILIDDINLKIKYWKNDWTPFYNNIDADCILIQIIPQSLELVSLSNDIIGDPKTWKPKTIIIDD
jgi:general stress protein 26